MPSWVISAVGVALFAAVIYSIYQSISANQKLRRLRRRYDYLLRGHGELNLEELIVRHGELIDEIHGVVGALKEGADKREQRLKKVEVDYSTTIETLAHSVEESLNVRLDRMDGYISESLESQKVETQQRLNEIQSFAEASCEELKRQVEQKMETSEQDTNLRFGEVEKQLERQKEEWSQTLSDTRQSLDHHLEREVLRLGEHISLSLQKVSLYRYNAFEDLAGDQSFSAVLLDEHGNGLILTSIYSRRGSSTFAKEIRGGQAVQGLSPEEQIALDQAMKRERK